MMLVGLIWAAFAPLSLVAIFGLLLFATRNSKLSKQLRIIVAISVALLTVLLLWLPARWEFDQVCRTNGTPTILKTQMVDGFFLDDTTANSFGMRYLQEEGFRWIEARSIYHPGKYTRYTIEGAKISQVEVETLTAKFALTSQAHHFDSYNDNEEVITDIASGEKLAWAHSMYFGGGPAKWMLGAWGTASCPSAMSDSENFRKMYHLAMSTLRSDLEKK